MIQEVSIKLRHLFRIMDKNDYNIGEVRGENS